MPRYFTLQEANTTLAEIKPIIEELLTIRRHILDKRDEIWPVIQQAAGNGGSHTASKLAVEFERVDMLVHDIQDKGVLLKDLNIGLLDFSYLRNGQEVYLCWKYGEENIAFWHEVEAGYAGRQPIETL